MHDSPSPSLGEALLKMSEGEKLLCQLKPISIGQISKAKSYRKYLYPHPEDGGRQVLQKERGETQRGASSGKIAISRLRLFLRLTTSQFGSNSVDKNEPLRFPNDKNCTGAFAGVNLQRRTAWLPLAKYGRKKLCRCSVAQSLLMLSGVSCSI